MCFFHAGEISSGEKTDGAAPALKPAGPVSTKPKCGREEKQNSGREAADERLDKDYQISR